MHPTIRYELHELEQLMSNEARHINNKNEAILEQSMRFEVDRIMQALALNTLTLLSEDHITRYIQYHQYAIGRLLDRMNGLMSGEKAGTNFHQVYFACLEELLSFVECYFPKYFDLDAKVPEAHIMVARKSMREDIRKFRTSLTAKNADPHLIDLVLRILKNVSDKNPERKITYRKIMYAKEVQRELHGLLDLPNLKDINEELRQVMYCINYNSHRVITYHAHYISSLLDGAETRAEKIERISLVLKKINQTQVKPGMKYNPNGNPLKDQLNNYITEELEYHQRLLQTVKQPDQILEPSQGFKLKLATSVSQVAYLLRILMETKFIENNNLNNVLHFLVKYVVTKRSEAVSHGSLRSKYYSIEASTKESVRNTLLSLIRYIDSTKEQA